MVLIHEKITALLEQRRLKKRDLARALGVSPQTATDICKGRSAITLPHLRNLVAFFEIRADFWLDDERLLPEPSDRVGHGPTSATLSAALNQVPASDRSLQALRTFLGRRRPELLAEFPDLGTEERNALGLAAAEPSMRDGDPDGGTVASVADA